MRKFLTVILAPLLLALLPSCQTPPPPTGGHPALRTVKRVDLKKYSGLWHEVARLPQFYEKDCLRATAQYTPNADGSLKVLNTCYKRRGKVTDIEGTATAVPGSRNTRLKVKFGGFAALAPVPDEGNYWIIGLDPKYQWAMVGTPDRKSLWFLSRMAALPWPTYQMLKERARELGFDTTKLLPEAASPPGLARPQ